MQCLPPEGFPFTDCRKLALTYSTETKHAAEGFDMISYLSKNAKTVKVSCPKASNLEPIALKFPSVFAAALALSPAHQQKSNSANTLFQHHLALIAELPRLTFSLSRMKSRRR